MSATSGTLEVRLRESGGDSALLSLHGVLDLATSVVLQHALDPLLSSRRPALRCLILDVSAVTLADVAGLTPVLHARAVLARRGGWVRLRQPSRLLHRLVEILGLDGELVEQAEDEHAPGALA